MKIYHWKPQDRYSFLVNQIALIFIWSYDICIAAYMQQWPGLGETDTFYSWVTTSFSLGALVVSPIAGQMPPLIGYRLSVAISSLFLIGGGLLYSFATNGWMVFMARFFMGVFDGCSYIFLYSHLSNIGNKLEKARRSERELKQSEALEESRSKCSRRLNGSDNTMKDKLFTINLLIKSIMYLVTFGRTFNNICYDFDHNIMSLQLSLPLWFSLGGWISIAGRDGSSL